MKNTFILFTLILFCTTNIAFAELFKWTDDEGVPHMTDRLDKVPKQYRKDVIIKEEGKPSNISQNHKKKHTGPNIVIPSSESKPYKGKTLQEWLDVIEEVRQAIADDRTNIESKKLILESFESSVNYAKDLNAQVRDLKARLAWTKAREVDDNYTAANKKKDLIYLNKQIKRVRARKNANLVKADKKEAIKVTSEEIIELEKSIKEKQKELSDLKIEAIRAGVPQQHVQ